MEAEVTVSPGHTSDHLYQLDLTVTNVSTASDLHLTQVTLISPQWSISALNTAEDMYDMTQNHCRSKLIS